MIVAKFEKISYEQFKQDFIDTFKPENDNVDIESIIKSTYDNIKIPTRATKGSAGYDFGIPIAINIAPNTTVKIPTGIRCKIEEGYVLKIYPRSGLGFKYRLQLDNTVGIIDQDYYYSDNEGHIFIKITNDTNVGKTLELKQGDGFAQGIFEKYYLAEENEVVKERNGGFGSTSK